GLVVDDDDRVGAVVELGHRPSTLPATRPHRDGRERVARPSLEEGARAGRAPRTLDARAERQLDREDGALPRLARALDRPAVLLDDPVREREPEARAAPRLLRREEGLEEPREMLGLDPRPVVLDLDPHAIAAHARRDRDRALARVRLRGVRDQVD